MKTMNPHRFRALCLAATLALALAAALVMVAPTPALATGHELCVDDPVDGTAPQADIVEVCAEYTATALSFTMRVLAPTDPETDPNWQGDTQLLWLFDTFASTHGAPNGQLSVHTVDGDLRVVATMFDDQTPVCPGSFAFDGVTYAASFDPSCLDLPTAITFAGYVQYDTTPGDPEDIDEIPSDRAPDGEHATSEGMAGPVSSDGWSCPGVSNAELESAAFEDRPTIPAAHRLNVDCAAHHGIVTGFGDNTYRPAHDVRRDQMASIVFRALQTAGVELPEAGDDGFSDVPESSPHAEAIGRLAAAGIVEGGPGNLPADRYGPALRVRRDQMASFLIRAAEHASDTELGSDEQAFGDVPPGNVHFRNVNGAAEQGLAQGHPDGSYRPAGVVRRDQTASFAVRLLGWLDDEVAVSVFFNNFDRSEEAGDVFPLPRTVEGPQVLRATLDELLEGPTEAEADEGYESWFSEETAGMVRSVEIVDGTAFVDFDDFSEIIPNASTSFGSTMLMSQLDTTATQFLSVDQVCYSFEGDEAAFYAFIQAGGTCEDHLG